SAAPRSPYRHLELCGIALVFNSSFYVAHHLAVSHFFNGIRPLCVLFYDQKSTRKVPLVPRAIPHNSKCRCGEREVQAAKQKAQIILCVLSSIFATQIVLRSRSSGA
ncbi:MAG: hypothetical protein ACLT0Z_07715, partial [Gemmiger sp.]